MCVTGTFIISLNASWFLMRGIVFLVLRDDKLAVYVDFDALLKGSDVI